MPTISQRAARVSICSRHSTRSKRLNGMSHRRGHCDCLPGWPTPGVGLAGQREEELLKSARPAGRSSVTTPAAAAARPTCFGKPFLATGERSGAVAVRSERHPRRGQGRCQRGSGRSLVPPDEVASNSLSAPWATTRPPPITTSRSTVASTSASRWLESSTVPPGRRSRATGPASTRCLRVKAVGRLVQDQHLGSPTNAWAMPSRCRMPSEYVPEPLARRARAQSDQGEQFVHSGPRHAPRSAAMRRVARPLRPGCTADASRKGPDDPGGVGQRDERPARDGRASSVRPGQPGDHAEGGADLPAPFGPRNPVTVPGSHVNETPSTTVARG